MSLDGAADWKVDDLLARGVLPFDGALGRMARQGVRAEALIPVAPSMTATAHLSMFTGAYPESHGVVSNWFLLRGAPINRRISGFDAPIEAETLWHAAMRQGKRVICATVVGAENFRPDRNCTLTLGYGRTLGPAAVVDLRPGEDLPPMSAHPPFEFAQTLRVAVDSPDPLSLRLSREESVSFFAFAVDLVVDGVKQFDAVLLDFDRDPANGYAAALRPGQEAAIELPVQAQRVGSRVHLLTLSPDLSSVRLYLSAPGVNRGSPPAYVESLQDRAGIWPGAPDGWSLERGWISESLWLKQADRLSTYLRDVTLLNLQRQDWDLMFTYLPLLDEVEHEFLLTNPRQQDYDAEAGARRLRFSGYVEDAYRKVDQILLQWMEAAPPGTSFVVVSDHGMIPIHTVVEIHAVLARAGFRITEDETTEVRAYSSGSNAHIYVNLRGRQPGGVVEPEEFPEYVDRIAAACLALRDPVTGAPVFEQVLRGSELERVHLGQAGNAGDVWVNARPGFRLRSQPDPELEPFSSSGPGGQHGFLGSNREIQAIFYAIGPRIPRRDLPTSGQVDVAPTVARLLGIAPPKGSRGKAMFLPLQK